MPYRIVVGQNAFVLGGMLEVGEMRQKAINRRQKEEGGRTEVSGG
jgi:hypothetical protein